MANLVILRVLCMGNLVIPNRMELILTSPLKEAHLFLQICNIITSPLNLTVLIT